ncbi:GumC family protein [Chromobacterium alticapitis]|uniref:Lipopolysaccharide biosynthesis protein n=1 Tax=Chromobacterium alticapitis TaxID=2073169 RepID=A0A2S5DGI6_9NEIS|nr:Wzz/FepE/Etk N-terminal domain-containing protein [Chromobacterium alticapitis]POZ62206.1 hypothetical protein C2I19_09570 [Chromobacterium alticapitis]
MSHGEMKEAPTHYTAQDHQGEGIDLMDLLILLARQRRWIASCAALFGGMALAYAFLLTKPVFTATTTIMPPQQQSSGISSMLGQLGGLTSTAGSGIAGLKNSNDLYIGMLHSRTVADRLIARFKLQAHYHQDSMDGTRQSLQATSSFVSGKEGLITISVDDQNPQFAATLANAYVEELETVNRSLAVTDASKRRLFFEQQLKDAKTQLTAAETDLRKTQERTGMIQPEGQLPAIVSTITQLRATIAAKEVQLETMKSFATAQNPAYLKTQQELQGLREQLTKLDSGQGSDSSLFIPTGKIAQSGLEYMRKLRELKYQETVFELLSKQYEIAKIDEAKDSSLIQVLDPAVPPTQKSKPKRSMITLIGLLGGVFLGILTALIRARLATADEASHQRRHELLLALKNGN